MPSVRRKEIRRLVVGGASSPRGAMVESLPAAYRTTLFDLGAALATPERGRVLEWTPLRIIESQVTRLEKEIDAMNANIAPLDRFGLPGGTPLAAQLHVARTLCRTAERKVAELNAMDDEPVSAEALAFINRLSDWLFVAGRVANDNGADDIKWVPGANR